MSDLQNSPEIDFNDLLVRAVAICVETVGGEGVPYWFYSQEAFPFFVARIANIEWDTEAEDPEDIDGYEFDVIIRHVTGNRTEGIPGEAERKLNTQAPLVIAALLSRTLLQSETYPNPPDWLESATLQPTPGMTIADASAIGGAGLQICIDYTLHCLARFDNYQSLN